MVEAVFISAGPNPRMRFKRVTCPHPIQVGPGIFLMCRSEAMVFFKHIALCPLHGMIETTEPWTEGPGGQT